MLTRTLGAALCLLLCTPGDTFAETTEATGTAALEDFHNPRILI